MKLNILIIYFIGLTSIGFSQSRDTEPLIIGEKLNIRSNILDEERELNVYLPANYEKDSTKTYPVIYVLDGSMDEDFIHIVGFTQFLSFPWISTIPESIVVGIANTDRKRDFTFPSSNELDQKEFPTSGKSQKFMQFLKEEVLTLINSNYRINEESTLIGQSLGGLLATEILLKHPKLFKSYIIVSPSLWWDDQSLLEIEPDKIQPPLKVYIAVGREGPTMESTTMKLVAKLQTLRKRELENSLIIEYEFFDDLNHGNILHQAVNNPFIKFNARSNDSTKN